MVAVHIPGYPSIVRCHLERGDVVFGDMGHPMMFVGLVAEYSTPAPLRDDLGFVTMTQMTVTAYSEN